MFDIIAILLLVATAVLVPYFFVRLAWRTLNAAMRRASEAVGQAKVRVAKRREARRTGPMATKAAATSEVMTAAMLGIVFPGGGLTYAAYDDPTFIRRPAMCVLRTNV